MWRSYEKQIDRAYQEFFAYEMDENSSIEDILQGEGFKFTFKDKLAMTGKSVANFLSTVKARISYLGTINEELASKAADAAGKAMAKKFPNNIKLDKKRAHEVGAMLMSYDLAGLDYILPAHYDKFFMGLHNEYVKWANKKYGIKMRTYGAGNLAAVKEYDKATVLLDNPKAKVTGEPKKRMHVYYIDGPVAKFVSLNSGTISTAETTINKDYVESYSKPVISLNMINVAKTSVSRYVEDHTSKDLKSTSIINTIKVIESNIEYLKTLNDKAETNEDREAVKDMVNAMVRLTKIGDSIMLFIFNNIKMHEKIIDIALKYGKPE